MPNSRYIVSEALSLILDDHFLHDMHLRKLLVDKNPVLLQELKKSSVDADHLLRDLEERYEILFNFQKKMIEMISHLEAFKRKGYIGIDDQLPILQAVMPNDKQVLLNIASRLDAASSLRPNVSNEVTTPHQAKQVERDGELQATLVGLHSAVSQHRTNEHHEKKVITAAKILKTENPITLPQPSFVLVKGRNAMQAVYQKVPITSIVNEMNVAMNQYLCSRYKHIAKEMKAHQTILNQYIVAAMQTDNGHLLNFIADEKQRNAALEEAAIKLLMEDLNKLNPSVASNESLNALVKSSPNLVILEQQCREVNRIQSALNNPNKLQKDRLEDAIKLVREPTAQRVKKGFGISFFQRKTDGEQLLDSLNRQITKAEKNKLITPPRSGPLKQNYVSGK